MKLWDMKSIDDMESHNKIVCDISLRIISGSIYKGTFHRSWEHQYYISVGTTQRSIASQEQHLLVIEWQDVMVI